MEAGRDVLLAKKLYLDGRGPEGFSSISKILQLGGSKFVQFKILVEIPGFEPGLGEPKSLVLPLHHISILGPLPGLQLRPALRYTAEAVVGTSCL